MSTAGDEALKAALEHLKGRNAEYLVNQNIRTDSNLSGAMGRQARALENIEGLAKQATEMRKLEQDFGASNHRKKISIAHALAKTLVNMTVRKLALWTILATTSSTGLAYAMYEINEGQVIDWSDTTGDGLVDSVTVDTDGVAGGDYVVQDTDGNGLADRVLEMDNSGAAGEVIAEGGVFETLFDMLGSIF